jgi:acyl carrier protein
MDTTQKLKQIVAAQLGIAEQEIQMNSILRDLGADSLDYIELALEIENKPEEGGFGFEVPDRDLDDIVTFGDLVRYVNAHAS